MAFTRFHDDTDKIMKHLQESTDQGLYYLNCPGNGNKPPYIEDPNVILQKWGANLHKNRVEVENNLMGIDVKLTRNVTRKPFKSTAIVYPNYKKEITCQPRSIMPAWTARNVEQPRWNILPLDPQENCIQPFVSVSTRILEKNSMV
jgi:hypothetical protein